jgi:SAM-dependent methyltransferase/uncharacterized protein YbaR (Trm112 family)
MYRKSLDILICPECKKELKIPKRMKKAQVISCSCSDYPFVEGILYLRNNTRIKAVSQIRAGHNKNTILSLMDLKKQIAYPAYFLLFAFSGFIGRSLGFRKLINLLTRFSYPKGWTQYLSERKNMPTYKIAYLFCKLVRRGNCVLEFGCGVGHILPLLAKRTYSSKVIGMDQSFFNLLLARRFFASDNTLLVCFDSKKLLPFRSKSINNIFAVDSIHNNVRKDLILKEVSRVVDNSGLLVAVHTANEENGYFENIFGVNPQILRNYLSLGSFGDIYINSDRAIWQSIRGSCGLKLGGFEENNINKNDWYTLVAAKKKLPKRIRLTTREHNKEFNSFINYKWDSHLINKRDPKDELLLNDHFIFLSPHLDDAVLSCKYFLNELKIKRKSVDIVSIFTRAGKYPSTKQAREYLVKCGYSNAHKLFRDREKEDIKAASFLRFKWKHLGYIDAAWRRNDRGKYIYQNEEKQFLGNISISDKKLQKKVKEKVEKIITSKKNPIVFAPLGVGGHVDHAIIREVARKLHVQTVYWEDYPYNLDDERRAMFFKKNKNFTKHFQIDSGDYSIGSKSIKYYKSQLSLLFPTGKIIKTPEKYYQEV